MSSFLGDVDSIKSVSFSGLVFEEKCKAFMDEYTLLTGYTPKAVLVKILGALCAGEFGDVYDTNNYVATGWLIVFSSRASTHYVYRNPAHAPGGIVDNCLRIQCPSGSPSWYAAGGVVPQIMTGGRLHDWQTAYEEEVTDKGLSNLAEANWTKFYEIIQRAYHDLFTVDTSTNRPVTGLGNHYVIGPLGANQHIMNPHPDQMNYSTHATSLEIDMTGYGPQLEVVTSRGRVGSAASTYALDVLVPSIVGESDVVKTAKSAIPSEDSKVGAYTGYQGPLLEQFVLAGNDVLLNGPTGTGKTILVTGLMAKLGLDYVMYTGTVSTTDEQLLGVNSMDSTGKIVWHDGPLTRAMRNGWVLFLDEFNRMPTRVQNTLLGAMAGSKMVTLMEKDGEEVYAEDGFQVIVAENLGSGYAVMDNDDAILDRFQRILNFNYPKDQDREAKIILDEYPMIDPVALKIMVSFAHDSRELAMTGELRKGLSTRRLKDWASLHIDMGGTLLDSAQFTIMHELCGLGPDGDIDEENKTRVTEMIKIKGGI